MLTLGPLGFAAPWVLTALIALPLLWLLLRAVPPRAKEITFPGTVLLIGLADPAPVARRTPWWLLALRLAAVGAAILGFAGPVWKPAPADPGRAPLLVVVDAGWTAAPGWAAMRARAIGALDAAAAAARPVAVLLADGAPGRGTTLPFQAAAEQVTRLRAAEPQPWETRYPGDPAASLAEAPEGFSTLWLSDGLDHPGRADWLAALSARGDVTVVPPTSAVRSLRIDTGATPVLTMQSTAGGPLPAVLATGPDPQGTFRTLARLDPPEPSLADGIATATLPIDLPSELRNRVTRFVLEDQPGAGAVVLADDRVRRRKVAIAGDARETEGQALLSSTHYLRRALAPQTDLIEGTLSEVLPAAPDVIILPDQVLDLADAALPRWIEEGGLLIRFAGPRMAASETLDLDPLLPARLRPGGRDVGGALSWGEPKTIERFDAEGPFAGLLPSDDVTVRAQLMADPDPQLDARTLVRLSDGTPLVTREELGQGQVVLVHTAASPGWSTLPLSGLFVDMLMRLVQSARTGHADAPAGDDGEQAFWTAETVLDGFGRTVPADGLTPVAADDLAQGPGPGVPAGLYVAGERRVALNAGHGLVRAEWPGAVVEDPGQTTGTDLRGWLIALAATLLAVDALASAMLAGRRGGRNWRGAAA
ncbi:BatA domain-containing protein [uncultured Paracoccus sp.]|uniref:BatA domain-containing protein n=1 Tax=uncultured Paracoccus sp. TaxID=189685 RepID=UPI003458BE73